MPARGYYEDSDDPNYGDFLCLEEFTLKHSDDANYGEFKEPKRSRKLVETSSELSRVNTKLSDDNGQLVQANGQLVQTNDQLSKSNQDIYEGLSKHPASTRGALPPPKENTRSLVTLLPDLIRYEAVDIVMKWILYSSVLAPRKQQKSYKTIKSRQADHSDDEIRQ